MGWANHDHHTFRSSREFFVDLIKALETLGFERRERYYAGSEAGWGAQILEQPIERIVVFADVDLTPEETEIDFSRIKLPPRKSLGTVSLWCGLHGESFLEAGMHHLECRFDHVLLREQLAAVRINTMEPFSDFPFLKQAFTEGEQWPVRRERLEKLRAAKLITDEQFQTEMAKRRQTMKTKNDYDIGCPLCWAPPVPQAPKNTAARARLARTSGVMGGASFESVGARCAGQ